MEAEKPGIETKGLEIEAEPSSVKVEGDDIIRTSSMEADIKPKYPDFQSEGEAFDFYKKQAYEVDISCKENQAVFYSGPGNRQKAEDFARLNGKTTCLLYTSYGC